MRTDGSRLFRTRVNGTDEQYVNPLATEDGMPGYAVQWIEVEGPLDDDPAGESGYERLFGRPAAGALGAVRGRACRWRSCAGARRRRSGGGERRRRGPGGFGRGADRARRSMKSNPTAPREDAERLLRSFLKRAYRRPVDEADVQRFLALFDDQFAQGVRLRADRCSRPTRPSWRRRASCSSRRSRAGSTTTPWPRGWPCSCGIRSPTTRCGTLADRGELHKPDVLRAQTERMLDDPKSRRFVDAFTDYWLDLRKIDDTSPSTTLYNDYELDDPLKLAALEETRLFFAELLRADLPARNVVDSDFTFLNERLAEHYGIARRRRRRSSAR